MRLAFSGAAAPGRVRVYPPHSASLVCALAFLAAVAGQVNFDYQVTLGPTIDPNSIGSGVGTVAGGFTRPGGTPAGLHNSKLFVADTGRHVIKGIDRGSGGVETVAGKEDESGLVDGVRNEARFYNPHGVAVSADGNLFITDTMNNAIRRMRIDDPNRYAVDTVWSRYSSSYAESSIVCDGGVCGSVPGNVSGLWSPMAVAVWDVDGMFALLIADTDNHRIVKLSPADPDDRSKTPWVLDHFAGRGERGFVNGAAYMASFRYPHAVAVCKGYVIDDEARRRRLSEEDAEADEGEELTEAAAVTVLVADTANNVIRQVLPRATAELKPGEDGWGAQASVSTLAGDGSPGSEDSQTKREKPKASVLTTSIMSARFALPQGVDCDGARGAVVADTYNQAVRHVGADGITVTLAGGRKRGGADGGGRGAEFAEPVGIFYLENEKNAYVVEQGGQKVRRVGVGDLSYTIATSAAAPPPRPTAGAAATAALAGGAAAWLAAWRGRLASARWAGV